MASNADEVAAARAAMHDAIGPQPDMDAILDATFEGWQPKPGDKLTGTILTRSTSDAGGYGSYPLLEILTDDGQGIALHCFHTVLKTAVERWDPKPGEYVGVKYLGKLEGRGSFEGYEDYRMVVRR